MMSSPMRRCRASARTTWWTKPGRSIALVPEEHRAWHAGISSWEGDGDVNARSIGIEIVNGGHDFDLPEFPDAQIESVIALLKEILRALATAWRHARGRALRYRASAQSRSRRESFPGSALRTPAFRSGRSNVVVELSTDDPVSDVQQQLAFIGYPVTQTGYMDEATKTALIAFQRRFRPS
jgi:N-acetylmuramoyl-L-alanine amidase